MSIEIVYIALGSNLHEPQKQIHLAIDALDSLTGLRVLKTSSLYRSSPMGPADQPDFINAVVKAETGFSALDLLDRLQAIEQQMGRVRDGQRWGPRVIDLDLLLFGSETIATPRLTVPHYGLAERAFVLVPLAEINPGLMIPGQGALQGLLERTDSAMIEALEKL